MQKLSIDKGEGRLSKMRRKNEKRVRKNQLLHRDESYWQGTGKGMFLSLETFDIPCDEPPFCNANHKRNDVLLSAPKMSRLAVRSAP